MGPIEIIKYHKNNQSHTVKVVKYFRFTGSTIKNKNKFVRS